MDENKPKNISPEKWVKKGNVYTVVYVVNMSIQVGKVGYSLEEIILDETCFPYQYFSADRFRIAEESDLLALNEELELENI